MRITFLGSINLGLSILFAGCTLLSCCAYDVGSLIPRDDLVEVQNLVLSFFRHNLPPASLVCAKREHLEEQTARSFGSGWAKRFKQIASMNRRTPEPHLWPQFMARRFISESDCTCSQGYTSASLDSSCDCIVPLKIGLELEVSLDTLFPLVIELAKELADGSFLPQSQVRIVNVEAVYNDDENTDVHAHLIPLDDVFDSTTAQFIAQRFWTKQVDINQTLFGNYSILYIDYPGLPQPNTTSGSPFIRTPSRDPGVGLFPGNKGRGGRNSRLGRGVIVIIVLSSAVAIVLLLATIWLLRSRGSESTAVVDPSYVSSLKLSGCASLPAASYDSTILSFSSGWVEYSGSVRTFSLSELRRATDNFKLANVVGEGSFGRVFRGQLQNGVRVAVKVMTHSDDRGGREFFAEAELSSRLHHRNLVQLLGVCAEGRIRSLVYEFIPNGSVEAHLHGREGESVPLSWNARVKIALGAARGLAYLHDDSNPRVIHRDFNSSNILLEYDFTPKISDFGLAKIASEGWSEHISTRVMGTFGYVAPEYAMTGHLVVKSDVYSYGVVLLELLSGRKPVDMSRPPGQENLVTWARPLLNAEHVDQLLDPALKHGVRVENVIRVSAIASMCVQSEVSHRPFMAEVVRGLKLVYNDLEVSERGPSVSGSHVREDLASEEGNRVSGENLVLKSRYALSGALAPDSGPMHMGSESDPPPVSEFLSYSNRSIRRLSGSSPRHSDSGPLRTTRSRPAGYRATYQRWATMNEHSNNNLEVGLRRDRFELWP